MRHITVAGIRRRGRRYRMLARARLIGYLQDGSLSRSSGFRSPVDFTDWLRRGAGRKASGHPDSWRVDPQLPLDDPARIAVLIHVYYVDLFDELLSRLAAVPVEFDLIVTNASETAIAVERDAVCNLRNVVVFDVENHGRDMFPLAQVVNAGILDPYEVVLKLHTKKSPWRKSHAALHGSGGEWKDALLGGLLAGEAEVTRILDAFARDPSLGLVTSPGSILGSEYWGSNEAITGELLRRLELAVDPDSLRFAAGSMYWVRGFVLQGLRSLGLTSDDFDTEAGQIDGTTAHALERALGVLTEEAGLKMLCADQLPVGETGVWSRYRPDSTRKPRVRFIPFYLGQFHPTSENDVWWGKGFTEWTNVTAARPVFRGHHQPKLPGELGFYDLRLHEVRDAQARLAEDHGIDGFMYYYYWFAGQRLLSRPIEGLLEGETSLPFCVMWANENWTRRWDGRATDVLIGQDYDLIPAEGFIEDVMPFLKDKRYMRVNGDPILAVYRPGQIPNLPTVLDYWRRRAREEGIGELHLLAVNVAEVFHGLGDDFGDHGFDGTLGFPPHNLPWEMGPVEKLAIEPAFRGNLMSYGAMVDAAISRLEDLEEGEHPGVMVNFDNTARRQWEPDIWYGSNPYTFRRWLNAAAASVGHRDPESRVVFINAWNEWAEGAVLEPTDRSGRAYLHAVRDVALG